MSRILILDYGVGNLASISASLRKVGSDPEIVPSLPLDGVFKGLILPGVGSYSTAFGKIYEEREKIVRLLDDGIPILGICLGLQLMFNGSEEDEDNAGGLGLFRGLVRRMPAKRLPHIGWNRIEVIGNSRILEGLDDNSYMYFVHSYAPLEYDPHEAVAFTHYEGLRFPVSFEKGCLFGVQFHPEKSGPQGLKILSNFVSYSRR
ncbi:MAG: imidazole glycerol phosphate synthase subunit HisH [Thermoproteota archaeon]